MLSRDRPALSQSSTSAQGGGSFLLMTPYSDLALGFLSQVIATHLLFLW
jgi:hypothetical protein